MKEKLQNCWMYLQDLFWFLVVFPLSKLTNYVSMTFLSLLALVITVLVTSGCASTTGLSMSQMKDLTPTLEECQKLPKLRQGTAQEVLDNHRETVRIYLHCKKQVDIHRNWKEHSPAPIR